MESRSSTSKYTPSGQSNRSGISSFTQNSGSQPTLPLTNSAYHRIFSDKYRKFSLLPSFLQRPSNSKGLTEKDLQKLRFTSLYKQKWIFSRWIPREEAKEPVLDRISPKTIEQIKEIEKTLRGECSKNFELQVGEISIQRDDLFFFNEGTPEAALLIDAYMCTLRRKHERVLVSSCEFANQVFVESAFQINHTQFDILNYDCALFPFFNEYWRLLVLDMKTRYVYFYDPTKKHEQINRILASLFRLLRGFLLQSENKFIDNTVWRDLHYAPVDTGSFAPRDSAVFVCKQAYLISQKRGDTLDSERVEQYKQDVILSLLD